MRCLADDRRFDDRFPDHADEETPAARQGTIGTAENHDVLAPSAVVFDSGTLPDRSERP